ncbi:MAG: WD40 repeat [Glomeribacter sp. 1016415]|nr:WD40 repeat [Glomeribacter sp. 1016415]
MFPINSNKSTLSFLASHFPNLLNTLEPTSSTDAEDNAKGKSIVQISESCLVSNQASGNNNRFTTHIHLTPSNAKPVLEILRLQQIKALQPDTAPLANLGESIETMRKNYLSGLQIDETIRDALSLYVAPEGKVVGSGELGERFDLSSTLNAFLESDKKVFLLLGEAGSGKSTFNRYLARDLWEKYEQTDRKENERIPVFIPLTTLEDPNKNLLTEYFTEEGFSKEQIQQLQQNRRFIFILDGYDEIKHRHSAFYTNNKLAKWDAKVIISSRPEYLGSSYQSKFYPSGQAIVFEECELAPFSKGAIEGYVESHARHARHAQAPKWNADQYQKALTHPDLQALIGNPFLLKIVLDVLPSLGSKENSSNRNLYTRTALYEQFAKNWFARSQSRLQGIRLTAKEQETFDRLAEEDFIQHGVDFSQKFALALFEKQALVATYLTGNASDAQEWGRFLSNDDEKTRLLRFNAPLSRQGDQYRFIHKSVRDYFVARAVWEELGNFTGLKLSNHSKQLNEGEDLRVLWEVLDPSFQVGSNALLNRLNVVENLAVQHFLAEQVQQKRALVKPLLAWIKLSTSKDGVSTAAANAITILVRAGIYLSRLNLSKVNVHGADLSYGVFDQTCFKGANLSGVKFRNAWLRGVNLAEANLQKVDFGELPSLEIDGRVRDFRYSFNKEWLAVSTSNKVNLYQTKTLEIKEEFVGEFWSIDFTLDSQILALGSEDNKVILWNWNVEPGGQKEELVGHEAGVLSINFSKNNKYLASGGKDGQVNLWDLKEPKILHKLEKCIGWVNSVNFSPNNELLASGRSDGAVKIWKLEEAQVSILYNLKGHNDWGVNCVKFSLNNDFLASGGRDKKVKVWKVKDGKELYTFEGHNGWVTSIDFSKDDKVLASGSADKTVKLWSIENGNILHTFEGHSSWVSSVNFSTDEQASSSQSEVLASGSYDGTVRLWKVQDGETPHAFTRQGGWVSSANFSSDGKYLGSGSEDGIVRLWNVKDGQGSAFHTFQGHDDKVLSLAFSRENKKLASGSKDKTVMLWDVDTKELSGKLEGHESAVLGVSFSPNSALLVSGSEDGIVKIWDVKNKNALYSFEENSVIKSMNFSLDGKFLAFGNRSGEVKIWSVESQNVEDWKVKYSFHKHSEDVKVVQFSPSGKLLASGSYDKTVRLWEINGERENSIFAEHGDGISSLNFSKQGSSLLSGSWDGIVKVWSIDEGKCSTTHAGFVGLVGSIVWQETSENNLGMVAGSRGSAVHIWQISKENTADVGLYWASSQNELMVAGISGKPQGLDPMNARLLAQRQKTITKKSWQI